MRTLISTEDGDDPSRTIGSRLSHPDLPVDDIVIHADLAQRVRTVLSGLRERDRRIVEMYYYRNLTFKEIATALGVTESRISQIHSRIKRLLHQRLAILKP